MESVSEGLESGGTVKVGEVVTVVYRGEDQEVENAQGAVTGLSDDGKYIWLRITEFGHTTISRWSIHDVDFSQSDRADG